MQTIHLTEDQVGSYLGDFGARIGRLGDKAPQVWVPVGASGAILSKRLAKAVLSLRQSAPQVLFATYDRRSDVIAFADKATPETIVSGKRVLLIDGTVHTGGTLLRVLKELNQFSPAAVSSYALAVDVEQR